MTFDMDRTDRKIINLLEQDARVSYTVLGKELGLAASSVHGRVRRLEQAGVIRRYRAEIDFALVGLSITALVNLETRPGSPADLPARIADQFPLVESCYSVAGDNSYTLLARAASTKALEEMLDALRAKLQVITRSTIVLSIPFENRPILRHHSSRDDGPIESPRVPHKAKHGKRTPADPP